MKLNKPLYTDKIGASVQNEFGGLRHVKQAADGELYDMKNLSADTFPLLQTRARRWSKKLVYDEAVYGFRSCGEYLVWSAGNVTYYGTTPGDSSSFQTSPTEKRYARLNSYTVVLPDKKYFYKHTSGSITTGALELRATTDAGHATFENGTLYDVPAVANTLHIADNKVREHYGDLKVGDFITISGCTGERANNLSANIREIEITGSEVRIRFDENVFTLPGGVTSYKEPAAVTIVRTVPDMDYIFENGNRLWGYKGSTIYASKLGDPFNWNVYEGTATDAWSTPLLSAGDITGACSYNGYPIFFKENSIVKVYGSIPSEFRVSETTAVGVKAGCDLSLAEVDGVLFYLSSAGVCAYTGGVPTVISDDVFVRDWICSGTAGTDSRRYYLSARTKDGEELMLVYDVANRVWHREDDARAVGWGYVDDVLCFMDPNGILWASGPLDIGYKAEETLAWMAEFGDTTVGTTRKKAVSKIEIRAELKGTMTVSLSHDGREWKKAATVTATDKRTVTLPVRPCRADHFRLRLEGDGECTVYSIVTYRYVGSSK